MTIKLTILGILVYAAIAAHLAAFVTMLINRGKSARILFATGFLLGCSAVAYRWLHVKHIPMQNLFEVFLCLGALVYPISIFCNRVLKIGGRASDMLIGAIVLFPAGFIFSAEPQRLPPALQSWLFAPHVFVYMLAYIFMSKAAVQAAFQLAGAGEKSEFAGFESATYLMICAGFPLLTLGLILGSVWGELAWGDWWGWDPKELWSLASWLVYVGYLHFRYMFGKKHSRLNSLWVIGGFFVIVITLLWVNLSNLFSGLHSYAT